MKTLGAQVQPLVCALVTCAMCSAPAHAEIFKVSKPTVTTFSAQLLISFGALVVFVLLAVLFLRKTKQRRFSFSLAGLFVFCLACSLMVWGGVRWRVALEQLWEYNAALEFRRKLDAPVSCQFQNMSIDQIASYLSDMSGFRVECDPALQGEPLVNNNGIVLFGEHTVTMSTADMKFENAVLWAARLAGAQCEVRRAPDKSRAYSIVLVSTGPSSWTPDASSPLSAAEKADGEAVKQKFQRKVKLDLTRTDLSEALVELTAESILSMLCDPKVRSRPLSLQMQNVEAKDVLQTILKKTKCDYVIRDQAIYLFDRAADLPDEPHVAATRAKLAQVVSVGFSDALLEDAIKNVAELTGVAINFARAPDNYKKMRITLKLRDMSAANVLKWITRLTDLQFGYGQMENSLFAAQAGDFDDYPNKQERALAEQQTAEIKKKLHDYNVSFNFEDKPLTQALEYISASAKFSIVLDPRAVAEGAGNSPITLRATDMPAELALKWILKLAELDYDIRDQAIFVSKRADM